MADDRLVGAVEWGRLDVAGGQKKPPFSAIPDRALDDRRLKGLHWLVLAAIASHDRMSSVYGGQGCYATATKMAARIGCHKTNFSKAVAQLEEWGYLSVEKRAGSGSGRSFTYRVLYPLKGEECGSVDQHSEAAAAQPTDQHSPEIVGSPAKEIGGNVGPEFQKSQHAQQDTAHKDILLSERYNAEAEGYSAKPLNEIPQSGASRDDARGQHDDEATVRRFLGKARKALEDDPSGITRVAYDWRDKARSYRYRDDLPPDLLVAAQRIDERLEELICSQDNEFAVTPKKRAVR